MTEIVVRSLTPELVRDYLAFFDHTAFADNPKWQYCYCNFLHYDHDSGKFSETKPETNREAVRSRVCGGAMHGYLAFDGERAIGWCHAASRPSIPALADEPDADDAASRTGSVVCFVIAKDYRRQGLARRLLDAACAGFAAQGLEHAEGYPREGRTGEDENHYGPLSMYLHAGFVPLRTDKDGTTVVRKRLV